MTIVQRILNFLLAILILLSGLLLIVFQDYCLPIVTATLGFSLLIYGIKQTVYYFRMARHMVGGRYLLYMGIIVIDFGIFTLSMTNVPTIYLWIYLIFVYAFSGIIDILRSLEAKRNDASWKMNFCHGVMNILIAVMCIVYLNSADMLVVIYGFGLVASACVRIVKTFRRTAIIYIQ